METNNNIRTGRHCVFNMQVLLVHYPPKIAVSALVNSLKGVSSRVLRIRYPEIAGRYFKNVLWSPSYFAASCGGAPISIIRQYVEQQQTPE